jgi:hypothetical protein
MRSFFAKYHQDEQLNDEMGRACGIHDETINTCRALAGKSEGYRQLLWSGSGIGPVEGSCDNCNKTSGSIKCRKFYKLS